MFKKVSLALLLAAVLPGIVHAQCARTITADVVAFDQVFFWNRLGAVQPQGMMYALRRDVVPISGTTLSPGNVQLRPGKRPRHMVPLPRGRRSSPSANSPCCSRTTST